MSDSEKRELRVLSLSICDLTSKIRFSMQISCRTVRLTALETWIDTFTTLSHILALPPLW